MGGDHLVEGTDGGVAQQALEAVERTATGDDPTDPLAQRRRWRLRRSEDRDALSGGGGFVEQHGFETHAPVPFDRVGEHARKDKGADPRREPMVDRADLQIDDRRSSDRKWRARHR
jgi:hypothetical protein